MADFAQSIPRVIKADNENALEKALFELQLKTKQYIDVINVYPKGSFVFAWIRIDARNMNALPKQEKQTTIKKKTNKRVKKA